MINLDSDVVSSTWNVKTQMNTYVVKQGARQWTVEIPQKLLTPFAGNKVMRRKTVTALLQNAVSGPADGEG